MAVIVTHMRDETPLQQNDDFIRLIADNVPAMIGYWSRDLHCHFANAAYLTWFGKTPAQMLGIRAQDLMGEALFALNAPYIEGALRGEPQQFERPLTKADGSTGHLLATYTPRWEAGTVTGFIALLTDMTETRKSQQVREHADAFAQAALNAMNSPLCVLDGDGVIVKVNQAWCDFGSGNSSGSPVSDFVGHNYLAVCDGAGGVDAEESAPMAAGIRSVMTGQCDEFRLEYPCDSPTERRWFVATVTPFQGERGFLVVTHQDVTALKNAQQAQLDTNAELSRSNAELEQFAYVASHDLIEPLRSISSSVHLLQKRYAGQLDARAEEFIAHAVAGATRMQALIADLLALARISSGPAQFAVVAMEAALADACANLGAAVAASGVHITHDALPLVDASSHQILQLLQNLVANAIKFCGDKPAVVHVGVRQAGREWVFNVADQGIGIAPQQFERIFELFKRLHTRDEYPGTGIGLALCKKIVERHGGRIWVESVLGHGATFYFTLPLRKLSIQ